MLTGFDHSVSIFNVNTLDELSDQCSVAPQTSHFSAGALCLAVASRERVKRGRRGFAQQGEDFHCRVAILQQRRGVLSSAGGNPVCLLLLALGEARNMDRWMGGLGLDV